MKNSSNIGDGMSSSPAAAMLQVIDVPDPGLLFYYKLLIIPHLNCVFQQRGDFHGSIPVLRCSLEKGTIQIDAHTAMNPFKLFEKSISSLRSINFDSSGNNSGTWGTELSHNIHSLPPFDWRGDSIRTYKVISHVPILLNITHVHYGLEYVSGCALHIARRTGTKR